MNQEYSFQNDFLIMKFSRSVYPSRAIYLTSFEYLDSHYVLLESNQNDFIVKIKPKDVENKYDAEKLFGEFSNNVIKNLVYVNEAREFQNQKELILSNIFKSVN